MLFIVNKYSIKIFLPFYVSNNVLPIIFRNNIQNTSNVQQNSLSGEDIDEGGVVEPALSSSLPKCPVCELEFDYVDLTEHIDICLRTYETNLEDNNESFSTEEDNDVDVDATDGLETYTWAGQTRIRSSSLIEGGLRGAGFLTITRGDEDQVRKIVLIYLLYITGHFYLIG